MVTAALANRFQAELRPLNERFHRGALGLFAVLVLAHWAEHVAQAVQIYGLGWSAKDARGVLGVQFPWLVTSEWMHYGYAVLMLIGFIALRPGFTGGSRTWWTLAMSIQIWHHLEHLLLLGQAQLGTNLLGRPVPTSILQLLVPRVELHLFYNAIVTVPMIVAMVLHRRPPPGERAQARCTCAVMPAR